MNVKAFMVVLFSIILVSVSDKLLHLHEI